MAEAAAKPRRRRRWPFVLLALVLLGGIGGALVLRHYTQPAKLTALLVEQARTQFGIDLALAGDAGFGFVPRLHLRLPAPHAKSGGDAVLEADAVDVVVPWRTLWGERIEIERIEIDRPRLDLDALSRWLASRPSGGAAPEVRFAVKLRDGELLSGGKPVAEGLNLDFANAGDLAAWLAQVREPASTTLLPPLAGKGSAGSVQIGSTRVEGLEIEVSGEEKEGGSGR